MMMRIKAILWAILCVICTLPAFAADFRDGNFLYSENGTNCTLINYYGSDGAVIIPSSAKKIAGGVTTTYKVTALGMWRNCDIISGTDGCLKGGCFQGSSITSVTIPNTVTEIGPSSFKNCSSLESVEMKNSVKVIGESAFSGCSNLASINFPGSLTMIDALAFYRCSLLNSVNFPASLATIGNEAFAGCSGLTSIDIPASVTALGIGIFRDCSSLQSATIRAQAPSISDGMFSSCTSLNHVEFIDAGISSIGINAFLNCTGFEEIIIPTGITYIDQSAFSGCSKVASLTIPSTVTTIIMYAFYNFKSLKDVYVSWQTPLSISSYLFSGFTKSACTLHVPPGTEALYKAKAVWKEFYISDGSTDPSTFTITASAGSGGSINPSGSVSVNPGASQTFTAAPNAGKTVSQWIVDGNVVATSGNSYTISNVQANMTIHVTFTDISVTPCSSPVASGATGPLTWTLCPDGTLTVSGNGAMPDYSDRGSPWYGYNSNITALIIGNGVTSIGKYAFEDCSNLLSVSISGSVASIGERAFEGCYSLPSITIPNGVTSIGEWAFGWCLNLSSITIPSSVTSIGVAAFGWCISMSAINVDTGNSHYLSENGILFNKSKNSLLRYPTGKSGTSYSIPNSVTTIEKYAFSGSNLTSVSIPGSVTSIEDLAFSECRSLASVTIPNGVVTIGMRAFSSCSSMTSVTVPGSVTSIGGEAFGFCNDLLAINVNAGNSHYLSENGILFNKSKNSLICYPAGKNNTDYIVPNSVISIEPYAFSNCNGLTSATLPGSVKSIGWCAFYYCTGLKSVIIPGSVTFIGLSAFYNCTGLKDVTVEWATPLPVTANDDIFHSVPLGPVTLHVPAGTKAKYEAAPVWKDFGTKVEYGTTVSVTGVTLNASSKTLNVNETFRLIATVDPSNATNQTVDWTSSSTGVATVDASGLVTAKSAGTATITVTTRDGNKTATCAIIVSATQAQDFAGGNGTQADPWLISTPQQLSNLRKYLGQAHKEYFKLANDIDVSSYITAAWGSAGWLPVGTGNYNDNTTAFFGHLDGTGHKVTGLWINRGSDNSVGLFGATGSGSTIEQLGIIIDNGKGGVKGAGYAGGLVGYNNSNSSITNSYVTGNVTAIDTWAGGLAGHNSGNITDCHATGNVTAGGDCAGGLVGYNDRNITNSYATGDVSGNGTVGGLTGVSHGNIVTSYATGNVTGNDRGVGGLTGNNNGNILNSYATGNVTGGDCCVGGLAGYNNRDITASYAAGIVTGDRTIGGFVGYGGGNITSCYFLKITGGPNGTGENLNGQEAVGLMATGMKSQGSFAGFDFNTAWMIEEGETYPYLRNVGNDRPGSSGSRVIAVTGVSLNASSKTLNTGETFQLTATVAPWNATDQTVDWMSDNINVATVDSFGLVTAESAGTATITVITLDGYKTATCDITVVAPGTPGTLTVSPATLDFTVSGETKSVVVTSNVSWTASKDAAWITVSPASGSNNGTVSITAAANTTTSQRTATVTVIGGGFTHTITVTQAAAQQQLVVDPEQPDGDQGAIDVGLQLPTNERFTVTFSFGLPPGFMPNIVSTSLVENLRIDYELDITQESANVWRFVIRPKLSPRAASDMTYQQLLHIVYTMNEMVGKGNYEIKLSDIDLTLNSGEVIHQDEISVPVTVTDPVGNAVVGVTDIRYYNSHLYVNTPVAERISVYSPAGILMYQAQKQPGIATFNLHSLPKGVLIVRGGSGWARKMYKD